MTTTQEHIEEMLHAVKCHHDLREALKFARSCIKSGEDWSETCDKVIDGALKKAAGE